MEDMTTVIVAALVEGRIHALSEPIQHRFNVLKNALLAWNGDSLAFRDALTTWNENPEVDDSRKALEDLINSEAAERSVPVNVMDAATDLISALEGHRASTVAVPIGLRVEDLTAGSLQFESVVPPVKGVAVEFGKAQAGMITFEKIGPSQQESRSGQGIGVLIRTFIFSPKVWGTAGLLAGLGLGGVGVLWWQGEQLKHELARRQLSTTTLEEYQNARVKLKGTNAQLKDPDLQKRAVEVVAINRGMAVTDAEAEVAAAAAGLLTDSKSSRYQRGLARLERKDLDGASADGEKAAFDGLGAAAKAWRLTGDAHWEAGRYEAAAEAFGQELNCIDQEGDALRWAATATRLAHALHIAGKVSDAERFYREALVVYEKKHGPSHEAVAAALDNLGGILIRQDRYRDAESYIRRAIVIGEKLDPKSSRMAIRLTNLAAVLRETGRKSEAQGLREQALEIDRLANGPESIEVARDLINLGTNSSDIGLLEKAEHSFRDALKILDQHPEDRSAIRGPALAGLAGILKEMKRLGEAESCYHQALAVAEATLAADHPIVGTALSNLASILTDAGRFLEAEPFCRRTLANREKTFGPEHPALAIHLNELALLLNKTGRGGEAEPLLRRALRILVKSHPRGTPPTTEITTAINNLGWCLEDLGLSQDEIHPRIDAVLEGKSVADLPARAPASRDPSPP